MGKRTFIVGTTTKDEMAALQKINTYTHTHIYIK